MMRVYKSKEEMNEGDMVAGVVYAAAAEQAIRQLYDQLTQAQLNQSRIDQPTVIGYMVTVEDDQRYMVTVDDQRKTGPQCQQRNCGKLATKFVVNPYQNDIGNGKDEEGNSLKKSWWCELCLQESRDDI